MPRPLRFVCTIAVLATLSFALTFGANLHARQTFDKDARDRSRQMLRDAYDAVKKNYYDTKFHGLDWDARFHQADEQMKSATNLGESFALIADFLDGLKDSHTFFRPPSRPFRIDYGYRFQVIGDDAFISRVRPDTDADTKVHAGDQLMAINRLRVTRETLWQLNYALQSLSPQLITQLVIRGADGQNHAVSVTTKSKAMKRILDLTGSDDGNDIWQLIRQGESEDHVVRQRWVEMGDVMIWKMPEFFMEDGEIDRIFATARKHKSLILDLRGNHGGSVDTLERMLGNVFDHDVKIADRIARKETKPQIAKAVKREVFSGKLIVLIDSESASASELLARVIQLEHRGTVIGDHSAGAVMEARGYRFTQGADTVIYYGFSVTDADLVMQDGKSLEHTGVAPNEIILPTGDDIAKGRDPVLAHAIEVAGGKVDAAAAGKLFPFEWVPF